MVDIVEEERVYETKAHICFNKGDIAEALQSTKAAHKRIDVMEERIGKLDDKFNLIHEVNTNIQVLIAENKFREAKMDTFGKEIKSIADSLNSAKEEPIKEMKGIKNTIRTIIITAIVSGVITNFGEVMKIFAK